MVEVCGGIIKVFEPNTLCRPPEIGSSEDEAKLRSMSQAGVTPGWFGLLVIVAKNEGLSQTRLARALGIDGSTMVAMIDRLEENGWIRRQRSEVDRRSHALYLTEAGIDLLARLTPQVEAQDAELADGLSADDKQILLTLLAKIAQV